MRIESKHIILGVFLFLTIGAIFRSFTHSITGMYSTIEEVSKLSTISAAISGLFLSVFIISIIIGFIRKCRKRI